MSKFEFKTGDVIYHKYSDPGRPFLLLQVGEDVWQAFRTDFSKRIWTEPATTETVLNGFRSDCLSKTPYHP